MRLDSLVHMPNLTAEETKIQGGKSVLQGDKKLVLRLKLDIEDIISQSM